MAYLREFLHKPIDKAFEDIASIADFLSVFANDPYKRSSRLRFVQLLDAFAEVRYYSFVARIFSENVLDHYDCFLHHIVDLRVDQIHQGIDTPLGCVLNLDGDLPYGLDRPLHNVHVDLQSIFFQLGQ